MKTTLAGLALALASILPAEAATYNIAFDDSSNGVGVDWTGSFEAPSLGGLVTNFLATIAGVTYDTGFFMGMYGGILEPTFYADTMELKGVTYDRTFFTADAPGATQPGLLIGSYGTTGKDWGIGECYGSYCAGLPSTGTYVITEASSVPNDPLPSVPVPAGLPLLAGGLGLLGLMRRRKA